MSYRVEELKKYLTNVLKELKKTNNNYPININMLGEEVNRYSIDKIPTSSTIEKWITGATLHRDVYSFRSRKAYSQDIITNLENMGFYEDFEKKIVSNNNKGILPNIKGIESIECLNVGTMTNSTGTKTAEFDIQLQITYREV